MSSNFSLSDNADAVARALDALERQEVLRRIWGKDHTVWKPDPTEITNRLGWLNIVEPMSAHVSDLNEFSNEVIGAGFDHVVLLGMGGSSLGPEVLRRTFGRQEGFPELIVLDSVDPDSIKRVRDSINISRTLFLVSSKSGTTIEPQLLFEYFKEQSKSVVGEDSYGNHFAAITDPETPLARQGRELGFRRVFENQPDIGGRYSVLSLFGLVPAVLAGIDIGKLLESAQSMQEECGSRNPAENPGATLGAITGTLAVDGRDKLTLITSPGISRFGLWVEQLIAESTGKEGKGIVPVAGEPLVDPKTYGKDRLFVYLRLEGDENSQTDKAVESLRTAGQPIITIEMKDKFDLGAEFFRWEFAVPVAGSILGINPFDQPDVQRAKDATNRVLKRKAETGSFPEVKSELSLEQLLSQAGPGKYISIMAYVFESPEVDRVMEVLRKNILEKYGIATTFGYGPRFLHSTGQLHKGGPASNLSLQITVDHPQDIPVPGQDYTFGQLTNAQAMGDLDALQSVGRSVSNIHFASGDYGFSDELMSLWPQ
ncbi:MAG: glucose-6-phosphate isomerase [Dehalococcoidia bacterium]